MNPSPSSNALDFLKKNTTAVLATSYLNLPYASTIYYIIDDKFNFYFATKANTDKYLNLTNNKNVALVIGTGPHHISVQVRGHASILKDEKQHRQILAKIETILKNENKIENWPIKKIDTLQAKDQNLNEEIVYKIVPQHLTFINLDDPAFPNSQSSKPHAIIPATKKASEVVETTEA